MNPLEVLSDAAKDIVLRRENGDFRVGSPERSSYDHLSPCTLDEMRKIFIFLKDFYRYNGVSDAVDIFIRSYEESEGTYDFDTRIKGLCIDGDFFDVSISKQAVADTNNHTWTKSDERRATRRGPHPGEEALYILGSDLQPSGEDDPLNKYPSSVNYYRDFERDFGDRYYLPFISLLGLWPHPDTSYLTAEMLRSHIFEIHSLPDDLDLEQVSPQPSPWEGFRF